MRTPDITQTMSLLSALVHADEMMAYLKPSNPAHLNAYEADRQAFQTSLDQVRPLLEEYDAAAMLPVRRDSVRYKPKAICSHCGEDIDADEVQRCDICGEDGLGNCCIGTLDHPCTEEDDV